MKAFEMSKEEIANALLAGIKKLEDKGVDISNIWNLMPLSFIGVKSGDYIYGMHGHYDCIFHTAERMAKAGPPNTHRETLVKTIAAIESVARNENGSRVLPPECASHLELNASMLKHSLTL